MAKSSALSLMSASGAGRKDRNSALAAEFFETLANTHGNSAQAASLNAILERAANRYARKVERKAAKAQGAPFADGTALSKGTNKARKSSKAASKPTASKARTTEVAEDAAVAADLPARDSFVARMRALAASNESEGVRT